MTCLIKKIVSTKNILCLTALILLSMSMFTIPTLATVSYGIANRITIDDTNVRTGSIVSSRGTGGFILSSIPYDPSIVGVVTDNPAILIHLSNAQGEYPVVSTGNAMVTVSLENGSIKKGDPITTSSVKGVGMKATKSGYVVGNATQDFSGNNPNEMRAINVAVNIRYQNPKIDVQSKLSDIANLSAAAVSEEPLTVFKYVVAGFIIILSFIIGFLTFGRIAARGVDALGRNPLAIKRIGFGIALNVIITVGIIISGIGISVFILRI